MRIRDEVRLGVAALLAIQVLTMIAAVGLLARMTPAIDRILEENDTSLRAVERMLMALSAPPTTDEEELSLRRLQFERALAEAEANITLPAEDPVLERVVEQYDAALAGYPGALAVVRGDLWELAEINRESMLEANERAKRLGTAGAWALVFLGLIGLGLSLTLMRRARSKLINPVYELGAVLEACSAGDIHRRFNPVGASREFQQVAEVVNSLVAEHFSGLARDWESVAKLDRIALLRLLDAEPDPTLVCEQQGTITAANEAALDALSGAGGPDIREALAQVCRGESIDWIAVEPLDDAGVLCRLRIQPEVSDTPDSVGAVGVPLSVSAPVSLGEESPGVSGSGSEPGSGPGSEPGSGSGDVEPSP